MTYPVWITPKGTLGITPEATFYQYQLDAYNPGGGELTYTFISGMLPPGTELTQSGLLEGVPVILTNSVPQNRTYEFSVRVANAQNLVSDRTFSLTISNIVPPSIVPKHSYLGNYFDGTTYDGTYFQYQLYATEVDPAATLTWTLRSGSLPAGLTLSSSGLISGFILPLAQQGNGGLTGYSSTFYNEFAYDNAPTYVDSSYQFTVQVSDGLNIDTQSYTIKVTAKSLWTADNNLDVISDDYLTVDHDNIYIPIITTPPQALPTVRSNSNFAFKFDAFNPGGNSFEFVVAGAGSSGFDQFGTVGFDTTTFDQTQSGLPGGLTIDPLTGWMSGYIPTQAQASVDYTITVKAYNTDNPTQISAPVNYTLTVLGDVNNTITWTTASDLGTIDNGAVSQLAVSAIPANSSKILTYSLAPVSDQYSRHYQVTNPDLASQLPQGLKLLPSGLITGRVSFECFTLDAGATTIDKKSTQFDSTYTFSVLAQATDQSTSSIKTFTVRVNNYNTRPYENLYLKALPTLDQRETFLSLVNNTEIFPENLLYRATDPWFGRAHDIRSLFLPGLDPSELSQYVASVTTNHYRKRIEFGNVQTARAVDQNFNTKYEVVYIPLIDTETYQGNSPSNHDTVDYTVHYADGTTKNFSADIYPNSFENMQSVVGDSIGYANRGALPEWMIAPQANGKVLGFTRCIVLAYTVPNASALIAYRLKANGIVFNSIDFVADRYDLDNALTANYNVSSNSFVPGHLTTFDRTIKIGQIKYAADYAVTKIPFNQINNQTVSSVRALGGLDGVTSFTNGQTLIFAQQEYSSDPNFGWTFSDGSVVPGYHNTVNQRAGIWRISISSPTSGFDANIGPTGGAGFTTLATQTNGIGYDTTLFDLDGEDRIILTFVNTVQLGDQIQINLGTEYGSRVVFYNSTISGTNTVPAYSYVDTHGAAYQPTIFDNNKTLFINNRDVYQTPGQNDHWIKFPKTTILQ